MASSPLPTDATLDEVWTRVHAALSKRARLRALLASMAPSACSGTVLTVAVDPAQRSLVERYAQDLAGEIEPAVGRPMRLEFVEPTGDEPVLTRPASSAVSGVPERPGSNAADHPLVREVVDVFGAKIIDVRAKTQEERDA